MQRVSTKARFQKKKKKRCRGPELMHKDNLFIQASSYRGRNLLGCLKTLGERRRVASLFFSPRLCPCCYKMPDRSCGVKRAGVTPPRPPLPRANRLFHFANTSVRGLPSIWFLSNHTELCFPFWLLGVGLASSMRGRSAANWRASGCVFNRVP